MTSSPSSPLRRTTPFVYGTLGLCALVAGLPAHPQSSFPTLLLIVAGYMFARALNPHAH